jgi:hypothetical protein
MVRGLDIGFRLDRQWYWMGGEMDRSKQPTLQLVAQAFADARVPYAIIGGVAMQVHQREPRTTLDIDLAVTRRDQIPRADLQRLELRATGVHEHSEKWISQDGTPVQITDDPAFTAAIARTMVVDIDGLPLRVLGPADLLHAKMRAGCDPKRRRSKRLQDLADVQALLETHTALTAELSADERAVLDRLPR